ncbi:acetylserotonin O-methyltransferase [Actinocorallia sp. API 0066]|uniref:acetylserotonin O-methyltransferase n=1 Tax=Actinocorallia sp. API 0066 TaxID=2896846 RepID=UPI001E4CA75D|nr:acetylserotonin O-methyltransferase [Actinocorallia sp. API 0066]MCD0448695.1 acetylserotonin O-methyltransferase [Actinocorallia sp. API 0066]
MADLLGLLSCHAAVAASRLGVFDVLGEGPMGLREVAERTGAAVEPLRHLLEALVAAGYLACENGRYSERSGAVEVRGHWGAVLGLWTALAAGPWQGLAEAVRSGEPDGSFYRWLDGRPAERHGFHRLQEGLAAGLAAALTLPEGARTLLDVGGGTGTFSRVLCARHPELRATVVDLPSVVADAALPERVTGRGADLGRPGAITERGQDVVLLCNVLHGFPSERARALVAEAVAALTPGGTLLILESDPDPRGPEALAFQRFFDLNLWHTQGGRLHPPAALAAWAVEAGCAVRLAELPEHPAHLLLTARAAP